MGICLPRYGTSPPCGLRLAAPPEAPYHPLTPTLDPNAPYGVYIPKDLDDALREFEKMLHPEVSEYMRTGPRDDMILYHHSLGRWMRNHWGLWSESRLARYFEKAGVDHPDSMSSFVLQAFWLRKNSLPLESVPWIKLHLDHLKDQEEHSEKK